ncbi:hypothetical protein Pelo_17928 [Pelomyxa schiedti]|nr:hypothetical protein Pelo_17928 [Pelomyxa schiedti]
MKTFYRQNCTASKEDQPVVFLVDLEKTFRTKNLVIDEALSVPHQACGSMWVNATLYNSLAVSDGRRYNLYTQGEVAGPVKILDDLGVTDALCKSNVTSLSFFD